MSFDHNCRFQSSQCNIWEITKFLLNILASFLSSHYFVHLIFVLAYFMGSLIYLNVCCCNDCSCCWVNVNKSKKNGFSGCKNRICHHKFKLNTKIMAGQKKKLWYSEETPWFPKYYIGWIEIGNHGQKTSKIYWQNTVQLY